MPYTENEIKLLCGFRRERSTTADVGKDQSIWNRYTHDGTCRGELLKC
jgi:hypothetical protein